MKGNLALMVMRLLSRVSYFDKEKQSFREKRKLFRRQDLEAIDSKAVSF